MQAFHQTSLCSLIQKRWPNILAGDSHASVVTLHSEPHEIESDCLSTGYGSTHFHLTVDGKSGFFGTCPESTKNSHKERNSFSDVLILPTQRYIFRATHFVGVTQHTLCNFFGRRSQHVVRYLIT